MPGPSSLSMTYSRLMNRRRRLVLWSAAALLLVPVGGSDAQTSDRGLLGIAPVRRLVVHRPPVTLAPVQFSNTTRLRYDVEVFPALLGQREDGTIFVRDDAKSRAVADQIVDLVGRDRYVMQPDQREEVTVKWNVLPKGLHAVALGAVFQAKPQVTSGQLNNIVRLVNSNFLSLPGPAKRDIKITEVTAEQGPPPGKTLLITPTVVNKGEVFEQPQRAHIAILDDKDRAVVEQSFDGDIVFPGATRKYPVIVKKVLPAGDYTALAAFRVRGLPPVIGRTRFTLVGPNQLPTGRMQLLSLRAEGEAEEPAHVSVEIVNTGNLDVAPKLDVKLYKYFQGQRLPDVLASKTVDVASLAPQDRRTVEADLGDLKDGEGYQVEVTATATNAPKVTAVTQFVARKHEGFFEKVKRWITDHPIVVIGVGLALGLLLLLAFLRRFKRRIEERAGAPAAAATAPAAPAPAPAPATVPAAPADPTPEPAAPGLVNVNTASVAELQTLPGVGPKAAERIVEYRDEYGRFASVDDLEAIEGFGPARLAKLRDQATV